MGNKMESIHEEKTFEFGVYTLGDLVANPFTGNTISAKDRLKEIIEAAKLADEVGLDLFGIGEHHRLDYAASTPAVALAAIAQITNKIKLTSTTTVLSTIDPVRLFEDFATLDLISDGRAEIIVGRGAFVESFPLFGYELDDYDKLFAEHLQLLLQLNKQEIVTWSGQFRPALNEAEIAPRPAQQELPVWLGVGGTVESAARAGSLGIGLVIAMLGGDPAKFIPLANAYRQAGREAGFPEQALNIGITGHGYIAETSQQARDEYYPYYSNYWKYVNAQRGMSLQLSRDEFERLAAPETALFVGSPQQIAEKILQQYELFGHTRFLAQLDIGGIPFKQVAQSIELLATKVAPIVRSEIAKSTSGSSI